MDVADTVGAEEKRAESRSAKKSGDGGTSAVHGLLKDW